MLRTLETVVFDLHNQYKNAFTIVAPLSITYLVTGNFGAMNAMIANDDKD